VSVLDIDRDVSNLHVSPRDEEYTLPWLMSFGYASYNSYVEDPEPEEPVEDNTTESPDDGSQDGDGTDPGGDNNTPQEPESPQEPASPDGGDTGTGATQ
jgi:hypothetical protein